MRRDPFAERQNLVQLYQEMGEVELHELNADIANLTAMAQEVLRDEMKRRGVNQPRAASNPAQPAEHPLAPLPDPYGALPVIEYAVEDSDRPLEFTWKTPLCECASEQEALQLSEALRQAIDMAGLKRVTNKKAAVFGSYGWSKGGMAAFQKLVEPLKWDVTDVLEFRGSPTAELLKKGEEFGERFAAAVKTP